MNTEVTLFICFLVLFILGVLLTGYIDTRIKRKKAKERYIRRLEIENLHLKRAVSFYKVALETKRGDKERA